MALPFFYIPVYDPAVPELTLDEDNSRHVIQVLRMKPGEPLRLTDGRGHLLEAAISGAHKKQCVVTIKDVVNVPPPSAPVTIAISPLKNASRFEWFLEKATEIGVSAIIPLLCERTERENTRHDRLQNILVSAMLQSQQAWLPLLSEPQSFGRLVEQASGVLPGVGAAAGSGLVRLIAHCLEAPRATTSLADLVRERSVASDGGIATGDPAAAGSLMLIGPEGDFSPKEVDMALTAGYSPVSLGARRLRTETAGVVAAALLCIK